MPADIFIKMSRKCAYPVTGALAAAFLLPLLHREAVDDASDLVEFQTPMGATQAMSTEPAASIAIWRRGLERDWKLVKIVRTNKTLLGADVFFYSVTLRMSGRKHIACPDNRNSIRSSIAGN